MYLILIVFLIIVEDLDFFQGFLWSILNGRVAVCLFPLSLVNTKLLAVELEAGAANTKGKSKFWEKSAFDFYQITNTDNC